MSCADVQTIQAGNGTKTQFSFDFPYLFKTEIKVYFWNDTTKEWDEKLTTDATYPWQVTDANPTIVEFTSTAPPSPTAPDNVDNVRIRRVTNIDDIRALFNPGSAIRSDDLNKNFEQLRYAIQESGCQEVPESIYDFVDDYYWNNYQDTVKSSDTWDSSDTKIATTAALDARFQDEVAETIRSDETWVENDDTIPTTLAAAEQFDTLVQVATPTGSDYPVGKTWLQNDSNQTLSVWNGTGWNTVSQGGGFTSLSKVVYVDATNGNDSADGHRISTPKQTIRAAVQQINAETDAVGNGSVVVVAPGVYGETFPIDIEKNDVSIVGTSLRNCIVHPAIPAADQAGYDVDVPEANELTTMFRVNSGSYFQNLTLMGMKGAGTRGGNAIDDDATFGLPTNQGWNFAFFPGATIRKSPYIQNCTNFSDSQINNVDFTPHVPGAGAAGDITSDGFAGGGILVDGSVVDAASPLRSMVADSYTHTALNGPGILVVNNGYVQVTSSYAFFNHYHLKCLNGGQANLAASTTDFGRYSLIADGRSTTNIFTADLTAAGTDGDITFTIGEPTQGASWHGTATRPQPNMLVELNGVVYPILSSVANGAGWDVTISRPDATNRSNNLGLNGDVTLPATAQFFLRSMVASSGHTMEYVGSGTDYRALPENGGVPIEANQTTERNNGAIWTAITDHNGKFTVGDFFEVDQQLGFVTIPNGSIAFDLVSDPTPELAANLDANSNRITDLADPTAAQDAATKNYVDTTTTANPIYVAAAGDTMSGDLAMGTNKVTGVGDPTAAQDAATKNYVDTQLGGISSDKITEGNTEAEVVDTGSDGHFKVTTEGTERVRIGPAGQLGIGGATYGTSGQVLTSGGPSGAISWADAATGYPEVGSGGTNRWAVVHSYTVDADYSIPSGSHVINAGPMTVNSGVTVTIPTGSNWVIV